MKYVILITGASSGFGALTARCLAEAGHTVYLTMRETMGRNAEQVETAKKFAVEKKVDLRTKELDVGWSSRLIVQFNKSLRRLDSLML
jgi:NADP-dependent 3-hydroxy acid dehydrogenase YdfG